MLNVLVIVVFFVQIGRGHGESFIESVFGRVNHGNLFVVLLQIRDLISKALGLLHSRIAGLSCLVLGGNSVLELNTMRILISRNSKSL